MRLKSNIYHLAQQCVLSSSLILLSSYNYASSLTALQQGNLEFDTAFSVPKINQDGSIAIGLALSDDPTREFASIYRSAYGLQLLPTPSATLRSRANNISANGQFIAGYFDENTRRKPIIWQDLQVTPLPLGIQARTSEAMSISNDGLTAVGYAEQYLAPTQAVAWTRHSLQEPFTYTYLSKPSAQDHAYAVASSDDGQVIIGNLKNSSSYDSRGIVWHNQQYQILPALSALHTEISLVDVSADGQTLLGDAQAYSGVSQAPNRRSFLYKNQQYELLPLPPSYQISQARALSPNGKYVVGDLIPEGFSSLPTGFIWSEKTGTQTAMQWLNTHGIQDIGWDLSSISDVSNDGRTVIGAGYGQGIYTTNQALLIHVDEPNLNPVAPPQLPIPIENGPASNDLIVNIPISASVSSTQMIKPSTPLRKGVLGLRNVSESLYSLQAFLKLQQTLQINMLANLQKSDAHLNTLKLQDNCVWSSPQFDQYAHHQYRATSIIVSAGGCLQKTDMYPILMGQVQYGQFKMRDPFFKSRSNTLGVQLQAKIPMIQNQAYLDLSINKNITQAQNTRIYGLNQAKSFSTPLQQNLHLNTGLQTKTFAITPRLSMGARVDLGWHMSTYRGLQEERGSAALHLQKMQSKHTSLQGQMHLDWAIKPGLNLNTTFSQRHFIQEKALQINGFIDALGLNIPLQQTLASERSVENKLALALNYLHPFWGLNTLELHYAQQQKSNTLGFSLNLSKTF